MPCGQDFSLHTEDIPGAYPGWKAPHHIDGSFTKDKGRRDYRKINATQDIPGATADSKHNYIVTKRVTNPLKPEYRGLDGYPFDLSPPTTRRTTSTGRRPKFERRPTKIWRSATRRTIWPRQTCWRAAEEQEDRSPRGRWQSPPAKH